MMKELTKEDLRVGCWYRAKRFKEFFGKNNDRQIVYLSGDRVQYDSDTVRTGRRLPFTTIEKFLRWAKRKVTKKEIEEYNKRR